MKRINVLRAALLLVVISAMLFSFASCNNIGNVPENELLLLERGSVKFQVVASASLGKAETAEVTRFIETFRSLGIQLPDAITDEDETAVADCEILFGTDIKFREGCAVTHREIGDDGYSIKVVGNKIVVCGGSSEKFAEAVALLLTEGLGITEDTKADKYMNLTISRDFERIITTKYKISEATVGGVDLSEYVLSYSSNNTINEVVKLIRDTVLEYTGIYLRSESELADGEVAEHKFTVRISSSKLGEGYSVEVKGDDLVMSCYSPERYLLGTQKWINDTILTETSGKIDLGKEKYEWNISYKYSEFGAKGDGKTDDFNALLKTHQAANQAGLNVIADDGATYYIGESSHGKSIPIRTNVDFGNAVFIIDDTDVSPFDETVRTKNIFEILPSENKTSYLVSATKFAEAGLIAKTVGTGDEAFTVYKKADGTPILEKNATTFPMSFGQSVMLRIVNAEEKVYIRYGGNANDGASKMEVILVDSSGRIDPTTPLLWDYSGFTEIEVIPIDDSSVTVNGGTFITWANQLKNDAPEGFCTGDQYYYFGRGIYVARSNTLVKGIKHLIEKEKIPTAGGANDGGYPYRGWLDVSYCNNVLVEDSVLSGHRFYQEDRDTDGDGKPNSDKGTSMGTYDINAKCANNVTWKNCTQANSITNATYWGIMGSNFVKNLTFDTCQLSRFDAHQGVANATLRNSTIGRDITVVGSGKLTVTDTKKLAGNNFITLRTDYGSTWEGDVVVKNCSLTGYNTSYSDNAAEGGYYANAAIFIISHTAGHNFGYTCFLFKNIEIDNFRFDDNIGDRMLFRGTYKATSFTDEINPYQPPQSITIKNQTQSFKISLSNNVFPSLIDEGKIRIIDPNGMMQIN